MTHFLKIRNREEFENLLAELRIAHLAALERHIATLHRDDESFTLPGVCAVCGVAVDFLTDRLWGAQFIEGIWIPNWRERLSCPRCSLNNRQRVVASLMAGHVDQFLQSGARPVRVFMTEQVTPMFHWFSGIWIKEKPVECIGSEYFGSDIPGGTVRDGIRHEDVEKLSLGDGLMDLIVSNEVLEHVNDPDRAMSEMARVLRPGGHLLMTIPFYHTRDRNEKRAEIVDGRLRHYLKPQFHGNPVSADGSLVFTDYGWEILSQLRRAGFSDVWVSALSDVQYGHFGGMQIVFEGVR